jgi:hypothetical protein
VATVEEKKFIDARAALPSARVNEPVNPGEIFSYLGV